MNTIMFHDCDCGDSVGVVVDKGKKMIWIRNCLS